MVFPIFISIAEMFNLGKMKSDDKVGSGSAAPSAANTPAVGDAGASTAEKRPSSGVGAGLRKRLWKVAAEQPADASGSTARTPTDKGKGMVELEDVPEQGEYLHGALHPTLAKHVYEFSSEELMNRAGNLDGARNNPAHLENDVLSLTEVVAFLKAELKAEGQKAVAAYKASEGFESGLKKMGRVSYEFGYRMALERLRGKHPDITIEQDPFAECSEDANIEMDLDQPFNDGTPSEKQPTL
ncbi:hypothetical protein BHE74_00031460 [Ensete ventricosum]|nr:hypothetical protein BHE74_00031460 [Ensete ventricosum]